MNQSVNDLKPGDLVELVGEPMWYMNGAIIPREDSAHLIVDAFRNRPLRVTGICPGPVGEVQIDDSWYLHPSCLRRVDAGDAKPEWGPGAEWSNDQCLSVQVDEDGSVWVFDKIIGVMIYDIAHAKATRDALSAMIRRAEGERK